MLFKFLASKLERESSLQNAVQRSNRSVTNQSAILGYMSLFSSLGTLVCCALPSLLVLVGLGATVAAFLSAVPWLVTLSHHKTWVFALSGLLIASNFAYLYIIAPRLQAKDGNCSVDAPQACQAASRLSRAMLWISTTIYVIGFFTAYVLGRILYHAGD